ncbi:MAG TPA: TIR domain-containing protein [Terriglobales bacterium]|nr:TIR domain-containing protein [Terriglobales bacterium]
MARRVFFSFHYEDIWRVNVVRNSHVVEGCSAAGFQDASMWEEAKKKGDAAIKKLIEAGLSGTSVTAVLIGPHTYSREYVNYEIERSIERGNGLLGIYIHQIKDKYQQTTYQGSAPTPLVGAGAKLYLWDGSKFGDWVEEAYKEAERKKQLAAKMLNPYKW